MPLEIERKYRVINDGWRSRVSETHRIRQGYLAKNENVSVRVRIRDESAASLTIKSAGSGIERHEYEYPIPVRHAIELLRRCEGAIVVKRRHFVPAGDLVWEIDDFEGANAGLVIAEIELPNAATPFEMPSWVGDEVTRNRRYYNANLSREPYSTWPETASDGNEHPAAPSAGAAAQSEKHDAPQEPCDVTRMLG